MLTSLLVAWAWQLRQCFGDLCSTYLAFEDLSLAADEEFVGSWRVIEDPRAGTKTTWNFGYLDSLLTPMDTMLKLPWKSTLALILASIFQSET